MVVCGQVCRGKDKAFVCNKASEERKGEDIRRRNNREHKLEFFLFVRQLNFGVRRMYVFYLGICLPSSQLTSLEWCQPFGFCMKFPVLTKNNEPTIQLQHPGQHDPGDKNLQPADGVS